LEREGRAEAAQRPSLREGKTRDGHRGVGGGVVNTNDDLPDPSQSGCATFEFTAELTVIEAVQSVRLAAIHVDSRKLDPTRVDVNAREPVAFGPKESTVEGALARAIEGAVSAGRWDVVAQLAKELEARRLEAQAVIAIGGRGQRN
jgi:hypothetical protein